MGKNRLKTVSFKSTFQHISNRKLVDGLNCGSLTPCTNFLSLNLSTHLLIISLIQMTSASMWVISFVTWSFNTKIFFLQCFLHSVTINPLLQLLLSDEIAAFTKFLVLGILLSKHQFLYFSLVVLSAPTLTFFIWPFSPFPLFSPYESEKVKMLVAQ